MKKEYVKPQNRVVFIKDMLMDWVSGGGDTDDPDAKVHFEEDSEGSDSSSDVWED